MLTLRVKSKIYIPLPSFLIKDIIKNIEKHLICTEIITLSDVAMTYLQNSGFKLFKTGWHLNKYPEHFIINQDEHVFLAHK